MAGVIEGMRANERTGENTALVFRLEEHGRRLNQSCERMALPNVPEEMFLEAMKMLIAGVTCLPSERRRAMYIRPHVFASGAHFGVHNNFEFMFVLTACEHFSDPKKSMSCMLEDKTARTWPGGTGTAKAIGNYAAAANAEKRAKETGCNVVLWLDKDSHTLQEYTTMNFWMVENGTLITPSPKDTILKGVTQKTILEIARNEGIPHREGNLHYNRVIGGIQTGLVTEVFGSGTASTVTPMHEIVFHDKRYAIPKPGKDSLSLLLFERLEEIYRAEKYPELTYAIKR